MADAYRPYEVFKAKMTAVAPRQSFSGIPKLSGKAEVGQQPDVYGVGTTCADWKREVD